jgi:tRNA(Arg) A34 adenosine deaminase TadA
MVEADEHNLRRAIELAAAARAAGDMPFGSLLVGPAGEVLAEDRNTVHSDRDVTAHPEYVGPALLEEAQVPVSGYYD